MDIYINNIIIIIAQKCKLLWESDLSEMISLPERRLREAFFICEFSEIKKYGFIDNVMLSAYPIVF